MIIIIKFESQLVVFIFIYIYVIFICCVLFTQYFIERKNTSLTMCVKLLVFVVLIWVLISPD